MRPTESFDDIVRRLIDVLSQEKTNLLGAHFNKLADFSANKERYISYIESFLSGPDAGQVMRRFEKEISVIKKMALENATLLNAAKAGVKSAQERLAHLNNIDRVVGTYTATGGQLRLDSAASTCKKIA